MIAGSNDVSVPMLASTVRAKLSPVWMVLPELALPLVMQIKALRCAHLKQIRCDCDYGSDVLIARFVSTDRRP